MTDPAQSPLRCERSDVEEPSEASPEICTQPVARALAGVIVYVDVRSTDGRENRSNAFTSELEALGATVCPRFTKDVTHVVFKDGKAGVREKAEKNRVFLVSPLWVEACKKANDWISEAKYPVITRDPTDSNSTPIVLGKIKRIKSMQPKPLLEEVAKSLERSRKRRSKGEMGRKGEKRRREVVIEESPNEETEEREEEGEGESDLDLPRIDIPRTPRHPLTEKSSNAELTPFLSTNNNHENKNKTVNNKHNNGDEQTTTKPPSAKVVASRTHKKSGSSKVVSKVTGQRKTRVLIKSKVVATKRLVTKATMKSRLPKNPVKSSNTLKKTAKKTPPSLSKSSSSTTSTTTTQAPPTEAPPTSEPTDGEGSSVGQKKKRSNHISRPFAKELPGLVMTSVCSEDQELLLSVVQKLGKFTITDTVDEHTTHLVCGRPRRTINVLSATVRGCWVVSLDWVWQSLETGRWLPEEKYELTESFSAAHHFRQEKSHSGQLFKCSIFKDSGSVYVSPSCSPPAIQLETLVTTGGGHVTRSLRKADICIGCHSPRESLEDGGTACVTELWILDSISAQKSLGHDGYILDRPRSRESSPEL